MIYFGTLTSFEGNTYGLKQIAAALLPEWVGFLRAEAHYQAVFVLMISDVLDHFVNSCRDGDPLDGGFPTQLLRRLPLLLQIGTHQVHNCCIRQAYFRAWLSQFPSKNGAAKAGRFPARFAVFHKNTTLVGTCRNVGN